LFNQYWQAKDYDAAFPYWYYLFNNAPCVQKLITFNGPFLIKSQLTKPENKARFDGLVDTIFLCHKMRIELFGDEGLVKGKWANDRAKMRPGERAEALKLFAESIALQGNKTEDAVPVNYMDAAKKQFEKQKLSFDSLMMIYEQLDSIIQFNLMSEKKQKEWKETEESVNKLFLSVLDCSKIEEFKKKDILANPGDIALLKKVRYYLEITKCTEKDFYLDVSERINNIEPSAEASYALARAFKARNKTDKAYSYYEKAAGKMDSANSNADAYYNMAVITYGKNQYANARTQAKQALAINPNMGKAYLLIGDAYATSQSACPDEHLKGQQVFWAAVDKYYRAKQVDPSVEDAANQKIAKYSAYFPPKETLFFLNMSEGDPYNVGCWIGEATTVRAKK
jgi:tetratricopeptide (TPR) repeat protein